MLLADRNMSRILARLVPLNAVARHGAIHAARRDDGAACMWIARTCGVATSLKCLQRAPRRNAWPVSTQSLWRPCASARHSALPCPKSARLCVGCLCGANAATQRAGACKRGRTCLGQVRTLARPHAGFRDAALDCSGGAYRGAYWTATPRADWIRTRSLCIKHSGVRGWVHIERARAWQRPCAGVRYAALDSSRRAYGATSLRATQRCGTSICLPCARRTSSCICRSPLNTSWGDSGTPSVYRTARPCA